MPKVRFPALSALFIILVILLVGCGSQKSIPTDSHSGSQNGSQNSANTQPSSDTNTKKVTISGNAYSPSEISINKGETVTWTNQDSVKHDVKGGPLDSKLLAKGESFSYIFNDAGTIDYICSVHPFMKGKVIVKS